MTNIVKFFVIASVILWTISLFFSKPATFDDFLSLSQSVIEILTPIGVFLLGYLGLIQWREETDYKKKSSLAEEIATLVLAFTEMFDLYRGSWADATMGEFVTMTGDTEADTKALSFISSVSIFYNQDNFSEKVGRLENVKSDLDWKLKQASTLWNYPKVSQSSQKLFNLFYDFENAIFRINQKFPDNHWSFGLEEIEGDQDLQLIYKFKAGTRNKSIDELNDFFENRLREAKLEISSIIDKYLTTNPK